MTLQQLKDVIDKLYIKDKANWHKEVIGDIKPGLKVSKVKLYGDHYIALYDEREQ
jgi:hypothetical protein